MAPQLPDPGPYRVPDTDPTRVAWIVAALSAATYLALVVCAYGFISLLAGLEPVGDSAVGPFVVPAAVAASVVAVLLALARTLRRLERSGPSVLWAALWSWVAGTLGVLIGYVFAVDRSSLLAAVEFAGLFGIGWFGVVLPACAAFCASLAVLVARGRRAGMARPRWPWERDEDE